MKCNKDEALKAKAIAETKFMAGDLRGGYKLALFARKLYPQLEGLAEMITAMQVRLTASAAGTGFDWYGILQLTAFSDISVVQKQYKKLALLLHPAKNESPIAEGAYRLIANAWACLSDPRAKLKYDGERRTLIENHKEKGPAVNAASSLECEPQENGSRVDIVELPSLIIGDSETCNGNTFSFDTSSYVRVPDTSPANLFSKNPGNCNANTFTLEKHSHPCLFYQCSENVLGQGLENPQTGNSSSHNQSIGAKKHTFKKDNVLSKVAENHQTQKTTRYGTKKREASENSASSQVAKKLRKPDPEFSRKFKFVSEIAQAQGDNTSSTFLRKRRKPATCRKSRSNKKVRVSEVVSLKEEIFCEMPETRTVSVEDSDFNDFDKERKEECFEENQLWAIYDNKDLMPRWYGVIRDIFSLNPFTVRINWLEANLGSNDRDQLSGHFFSCGEFKLGTESTQSLNCFSHLMKGEKAVAGIFKIYPRKSSVWATYRNWKPDWDDSIPDETIEKYDVVEILTDFTVTLGGSVVPLVKIDGFNSIYQRKHTRSKAVEWVKKDELFRFSHQVPCRRLAGMEADNLPNGCWELDPAALR